MKIISCPIPGKSLIVQFEPAATNQFEEYAMRRNGAPSHGLLLGSSSGSEPKWLHIEHIQPVFGMGDDSRPAAPGTSSLVTLGYYTIRPNGDILNEAEREFLATSLPASSTLAMVVTGRMLAQFYLRHPEGIFGALPDHRQLLVSRDMDRPMAMQIPAAQVIAEPVKARKSWGKIWAFAGVAGLAVLVVPALIRSQSHPHPAPAAAPAPAVKQVSRFPRPDFTLPVKSVKLIQSPPEIAIWYPEPPAASASTRTVAEARRTTLVHPIMARP